MVMLGWVVSGLLGLAVGAQLGARQANGSAARRIGMREVVHDLEAQIGRLGAVERFVLAKVLRREAVSRDPVERERELTLGERVADRVASFGGSWTFIFLFLAALRGPLPVCRNSKSANRSSCRGVAHFGIPREVSD